MKDSQLFKQKPRRFKNTNKAKKKFKESRKNSQSLFVKQNPGKESPPTFFKKYGTDFLLTLIPATIFVILLIINRLNIETVQKIEKIQLISLNYTVKISPYPFINKFTVPNISAEAAIITEADSRTVLYSKNSSLRFSMASTTKIMTALVALDYYKENSILTIYSPNIEGSNLGLAQGEQFYLKDLLFAMLLPSSNEAAYAIAQNYPGGVETFVKKMNEKAHELNLSNTHFQDPIGLDDDSDYSTVLDLSRLSYAAIKNKSLAAIFSTKQKTISDITGQKQFDLKNLNILLGIDGVNGIKTGTTAGAGEVLITSKTEKGHTFIIIVMKSKQRFIDTKILLSLISNNISYLSPQMPISLTITELK
jgi:D-alanyl-D-alanine carboxypeptidase (penicillin-binding protein 5/6)